MVRKQITHFRHQQWFALVLGGTAFFIHLSTALLRIKTFFPYPKLLDFSAFYAAASALRQGLYCYDLPPEFLHTLQTEKMIPFTPPPIYNPPIWPWLLQPLTIFNFPIAAFIWVFIDLLLLAWACRSLMHIIGRKEWQIGVFIFVLSLTFGPVFLDLTLGQTSIVLLAAMLIIGRNLAQPVSSTLKAALSTGMAAGAKLFPAAWSGSFLLQRRWKDLVLSGLAVFAVFGMGWIVAPQANADYWFRFLPQRISSASEQGGIDDQALHAWLDRIGRSQTYWVPGLDTGAHETVVWVLPWSFDPQTIRWTGYILSALLGVLTAVTIVRARACDAEGGFYLWTLYLLLAFPHIERYNHALLLPAMAWLWSQKGHWRGAVVLVYFLAGLARLNHFWLIYLPAPWAPLASGFGTCAVLVLGATIAAALWSARSRNT